MNLCRVVLRCSLLSFYLCAIFAQSARGQLPPRVTEAVDDARRVTLKGNVHPLARTEFDRGAVAEAQPMKSILLLLKRSNEQEAALETTLQNLQDKGSPLYHQWLTPEQFGAQFGPVDADIHVATDWLTRQGFTVEKVYSGKTVIEFSGTAGQIQRAFGTTIHSYQIDGKTYSANASDPQIPAALVPVVAGIVSLHNFPRQFYARHYGAIRSFGGRTSFEPVDSQVTITNQGITGLGPGDFAKIYGTPATCGTGTPVPSCDGTGQTIAIVGETNFNLGDVQQFRRIFGLPATFEATNIIYNGEDPGITSTGEEGEALLDTQWSGAVAPGATIKYVLSASTSASQGVDLSALYIVDHNLAGAMSESYGACETNLGSTENSFVNNLWQQASAQGISVSVSTGDSGSAGCDDPRAEGLATHPPAVNGLASTPYNVAVGGTDFDEFGKISTYWNNTNNATTGESAYGYIPEIPWNQSCAQLGPAGCNINTTPTYLQNIVAGGGGASSLYARPSWQLGVSGTPSSDGKRDLPDISLFASPGFNGTGYLYCQSDASAACTVSSGFAGPNLYFGVVGGTSASAPAFAGVMALVNQSQATAQNPAPRQGNANYVLYALAKKSGASCPSKTPVATGCIFNDIVAGSSALPEGGTGIGTIDVPCQYGNAFCNATPASQVGVLESAPSSTTMAWNAGTGYDMASGLGSLNIGNLISAWGAASTVPTTTTLSLSPVSGLTHGSSSTVTINVAAKSDTATGTVSLIALLPAQPSGTTPFNVGAFTLGANGKATGTTSNLPGGSNYQVYAHYSGDGTNAPSDSSSQAVSVTPESSKTFIVVPTFDPSTGNEISPNATSVPYGSPYIVRVYVTNSAGSANPAGAPIGACTQATQVACPSGTISLTANGNAVDSGTFNLNDIGYTRDIAPTLPGGTYPLAAAYSGDSSYQPSTVSETFTVTPSPTTLNPPFTGANFALVGQPVNIGVMLNTQAFTGVAPTGTVTFFDSSTALTSPVTVSTTPPSGSTTSTLTAQTSPTFTTTGNHTFTAKYSGDANYASAASSGSTNVDVVYPTSMTLNVSSASINFGQSVTLTVVISSQGKIPAITGQPQFQFTGPSSPFTNITGTPGTDGTGNQTLTVTATTVPQGSGAYFATYPGDANYEYASSAGVFVNVITPDFSMGPQNGLSVVPTAGQPGSASITITPVSQIPSTVDLGALGGSIAGYTVSLNPVQVSLNGAAATSMLTLTPNGSGSTTTLRPQIRKAGFLGVDSGSWWRLGTALILALLLVIAAAGRRRKSHAALGLSTVCLLYFVLGCGGGGGGGGGQPKPTSVTLTTSSAKVPQTASYTITATVTGSGPLTGTISFYDYGNLIDGSVPIVNGGASMGNANLETIGVHQITATYSGDPNDLSATSAPLMQAITGSIVISIQGNTGQNVHNIPATIGIQ